MGKFVDHGAGRGQARWVRKVGGQRGQVAVAGMAAEQLEKNKKELPTQCWCKEGVGMQQRAMLGQGLFMQGWAGASVELHSRRGRRAPPGARLQPRPPASQTGCASTAAAAAAWLPWPERRGRPPAAAAASRRRRMRPGGAAKWARFVPRSSQGWVGGEGAAAARQQGLCSACTTGRRHCAGQRWLRAGGRAADAKLVC